MLLTYRYMPKSPKYSQPPLIVYSICGLTVAWIALHDPLYIQNSHGILRIITMASCGVAEANH